MTRTRLSFVFVVVVLAAGLWTSSVALAGNASAECGFIREYSAPNSGTSTPGSIALGLSDPLEVIAPDATLLGATATNLSTGMVTCLAFTREAGSITSLEFAPAGTIAGEVVFLPDFGGGGQDFYLVADRLPIPADFLATNSGLAALIVVPAQAGANTSITFQIDTDTGNPMAFTGSTTIEGSVTLLANGDVTVGAATLTADLIDAAARTAFEQAAAAGVPATVSIDGVGSIDPDTGEPLVLITLGIEFVAPTAAPTATPRPVLLPDTAMSEHE